ncbi:Ankyrin repeat [Daphnia magna]|uniref:Ankyrin repeat n=1 Tax=Daphnia magna TaxID=35525 RepID=A0A164U921_9CRUS|nr:Ankyrin repeat [Daphnia magna]
MAGRPAGFSDGESDDDEFGVYEAPASLPNLRVRPPINPLPQTQVIKKSDVDLEDFRIATMKGNLQSVKLYVENGVSVSQVLRSGWTALMYSVSCGRWQITEYLLDNKANPNFHKELFTPLMAACASSHEVEDDLVKCVELLISHGANVNATERHKVTPLMFACKEKRLKIVQTLLKRNEINIDLQDHHGWSALMWAADKGDGAIVRALLEHGEKGADTHLMSSSGQKAVDVALIAGHKDVAALLDLTLKPQESPAPAPPPSTDSIATVTELETVLMGLDLTCLLPIFYEHKMNYDSFLLMDDGDLDRMGISQVGYRTRLLNAVKEIHTKEWERGSLPAIQYSKYLSCPEATALVGNLAIHGRYMLASVAYLRDQIQRRPRILQLGMETASVHALSAQTQYAIKQISELQSQLKFLKLYLDKVQDKAEFVPADLITERNGYRDKRDRSFWRRPWGRYIVMAVVAFTGGLVLWSTPSRFLQHSTAVLLVA